MFHGDNPKEQALPRKILAHRSDVSNRNLKHCKNEIDFSFILLTINVLSEMVSITFSDTVSVILLVDFKNKVLCLSSSVCSSELFIGSLELHSLNLVVIQYWNVFKAGHEFRDMHQMLRPKAILFKPFSLRPS